MKFRSTKVRSVNLRGVSFMLAPERRTMDYVKLTWVVACVLLVSGKTEAKRSTGTLNTEQDLVYMDQFLFETNGFNNLEYQLRYPADQCCYQLAVFDDSPNQWTSIRPNEDTLACKYKLKRIDDADMLTTLSTTNEHCVLETDDSGFQWLTCHGHMDFSAKRRSRRYFFNIAHCNRRGGTTAGVWNLTYTLHMQNGVAALRREFSADRMYMMEISICSLCGYLVMSMIATHYGAILSGRRLLHLTYRLFYGSLLLQTLAMILQTASLVQFARSGVERKTTSDAAEIFSCLSTVTFISVLLLVAKGFSITRARISLTGTAKLIGIYIVYTSVYIMVFVHRRVLMDPRDIVINHSNLAAGGVVALKIFGFCAVVYGVFFTVKHHTRKALFYFPYLIFFCIWFLAEPVCIILSANTFHLLKRENITYGIDLGLALLGHGYFLYLTRPDSTNKRFPFHLRANQITFRGSNDDDHPYNPADELFSVIAEDKVAIAKDSTSISIPDDTPDHWETRVLPFHYDGSDDDVKLPKSGLISPTVPTVSGTVAAQSPPWPISPPTLPSPAPSIPRPRAPSPIPGKPRRVVQAWAPVAPALPPVVSRPLGSLTTPLLTPNGRSDTPRSLKSDQPLGKHRVPNGGWEIFCVEKPKTEVPAAPTKDPTPTGAVEVHTNKDQKVTAAPTKDPTPTGTVEVHTNKDQKVSSDKPTAVAKKTNPSAERTWAPVVPAPAPMSLPIGSNQPIGKHRVPNGGWGIFCVEKPKTEGSATPTKDAIKDAIPGSAKRVKTNQDQKPSVADVPAPAGGWGILYVEEPKTKVPATPSKDPTPSGNVKDKTNQNQKVSSHKATAAKKKKNSSQADWAPVVPASAPAVSLLKGSNQPIGKHRVPNGGWGIFCVEKPKTEVSSDKSTAVEKKKDPSAEYSSYQLTPVVPFKNTTAEPVYQVSHTKTKTTTTTSRVKTRTTATTTTTTATSRNPPTNPRVSGTVGAPKRKTQDHMVTKTSDPQDPPDTKASSKPSDDDLPEALTAAQPSRPQRDTKSLGYLGTLSVEFLLGLGILSPEPEEETADVAEIDAGPACESPADSGDTKKKKRREPIAGRFPIAITTKRPTPPAELRGEAPKDDPKNNRREPSTRRFPAPSQANRPTTIGMIGAIKEDNTEDAAKNTIGGPSLRRFPAPSQANRPTTIGQPTGNITEDVPKKTRREPSSRRFPAPGDANRPASLEEHLANSAKKDPVQKKTRREPSSRRFPAPGDANRPESLEDYLADSAKKDPVKKKTRREPSSRRFPAPGDANRPESLEEYLAEVMKDSAKKDPVKKKTRREPSSRRFPAPGDANGPASLEEHLAQIMKEPAKKTEKKSKQNILKKYLRLARARRKTAETESFVPSELPGND